MKEGNGKLLFRMTQPSPVWRRLAADLASVVQALVLCGPANPGRPSTTIPPINEASFFARVYFVWANTVVLAAGALPPIQIKDLPPLPVAETAEPSCTELSNLWEAERVRSVIEGRSASLLKVIVRFVWKDEATTLAFKLCGWLVASMVSNAILLPLVINNLTSNNPAWQGYVIALFFLVSEGLRSAAVNHRELFVSIIQVCLSLPRLVIVAACRLVHGSWRCHASPRGGAVVAA